LAELIKFVVVDSSKYVSLNKVLFRHILESEQPLCHVIA